MAMSWIWVGILALALLCAAWTGNGSALASAVPNGAQAGITLTVSMAGSICLWSGVGSLLAHAGLTQGLAHMLRPLLNRVFPSTRTDSALSRHLSANICANLLGLGNAATPEGVQAARRLADPGRPGMATDELCRLIVLNTASIQLIPGNVAAGRASLGAQAPFDLLPAVWLTSLCSAGVGVAAAWLLGKLWKHD